MHDHRLVLAPQHLLLDQWPRVPPRLHRRLAEAVPARYLALRNISRRWTMPIKNWSAAMNQFVILFDGRVPMGGLTSNSLTHL
jgi:hypothetical protein